MNQTDKVVKDVMFYFDRMAVMVRITGLVGFKTFFDT